MEIHGRQPEMVVGGGRTGAEVGRATWSHLRPDLEAGPGGGWGEVDKQPRQRVNWSEAEKSFDQVGTLH